MAEEVKDQATTLKKINKVDKDVGHCEFLVDERLLKKMSKLII